jgi:hypothetical protein
MFLDKIIEIGPVFPGKLCCFDYIPLTAHPRREKEITPAIQK